MKIHQFILFLGLLVNNLACHQTTSVEQDKGTKKEAASSQHTIDMLNQKIPQWQKELNIPNVGIALIEDGKIQTANVYGNLANGAPAPKNTLFNVASVTKVVVTMSVLKLVDSGNWDLDEPLYHYHIDEEVANDPYHKQLTTRHVLSQQSGFVNWRWNHPTGKLTFDFEPGTKFNYSGEGMEYLRLAIEKKFNRSLSELADSLLFEPLKMVDTKHAWDGKTNADRFSRWYDAEGNEYQEVEYATEDNAADDVVTTVEDLAKFGMDVMSESGLSASLFQEMVATQAEINQNLQQGLGWRVVNGLPNQEYAIQHGGNDIGVATIIVLLPKSKRGLVVFTNGDNGLTMCNNIIRATWPEGREIVHKSYKSSSIAEMPEKVALTKEQLATYAGKYEQPSGRILDISAIDEGIMLKMPGVPNLQFYPQAADTFFLMDFDPVLAFSRTEDGQIDAVLLIEGENSIRCEKK